MRSYIPNQGLNPCPWQWKQWVLITAPQENSRFRLFKNTATPDFQGNGVNWDSRMVLILRVIWNHIEIRRLTVLFPNSLSISRMRPGFLFLKNFQQLVSVLHQVWSVSWLSSFLLGRLIAMVSHSVTSEACRLWAWASSPTWPWWTMTVGPTALSYLTMASEYVFHLGWCAGDGETVGYHLYIWLKPKVNCWTWTSMDFIWIENWNFIPEEV